MILKDILSEIKYTGNVCLEREISTVTDNTSKIKENCIFVCIKGKRFDGHSAAQEALDKGAAVVVCEKDLRLDNQIIVDNTRSAYTRICAAFFDNPQRKLKMIGLTGTNGKTTTAFVVKNALNNAALKCGMLGTVQNETGDGTAKSASLTTPDPFELFALLNEMVNNGCKYCCMEVSSQALDQKRVDGIEFETSLFTNLTVDHLDYHGSMENYMNAKHILFENSKCAILNGDDKACDFMASNTQCDNIIFSAENENADFYAFNIKSTSSGVSYKVKYKDEINDVKFTVPGKFSVLNSLGALAVLCIAGLTIKEACKAVSDSKGVPGRMETVDINKPYTVIIDYAHTPDGLENVLKTVKEFACGRVIAVFGCGGDRDNTKRPIMGKIACEKADITVVTSDNPRSEDPNEIIRQILTGITGDNIIVEPDRTKAIKKAMDIAQNGDVIVLAGKGHETYQILSSGKIHYDEREIIRDIVNGKI